MKKTAVILFIITTIAALAFGFKNDNTYTRFYTLHIQDFIKQQYGLLHAIQTSDLHSENDVHALRRRLALVRLTLKENDFWLRYLEPVLYKKINGPLPVEWETEVFEKFEKPYKRIGSGFTLAEIYLGQEQVRKDSLLLLVQSSIEASTAFLADSISQNLTTFHHFFLANRLFLLNLASIYTTGFECPDPENIIPELRFMLAQVAGIYTHFNQTFPATPLTAEYLDLYRRTVDFVEKQPSDYTQFNHFRFIKDYVNRLFKMNQQFIIAYSVFSTSYNDYSLNDTCFSIFDKALYHAQNIKGIYSPIEDSAMLAEIKQTGKLLFFDPILSGNNQRSCASCHKPDQYFTDTSVRTNPQFEQNGSLPRNTTSLVNVVFNHLLMMDGRHISLQNQATEVMMGSHEMHSNEKELIAKVLSCEQYNTSFRKFLKQTPEEKEIVLTHITSALTFYYGGFSAFYSPFDEAMNNNATLDEASIKGFNLFMSKAQCATCHFVPNFNGVKPPFVGSEFEVLGVPEDGHFKKLSPDSGRFTMNPASEMFQAFRTGSIRNAAFTKPYMHNGVFNTLIEVLDFYDAGGGAGKKLDIKNQTLSSDSLRLTKTEKEQLIAFTNSLNEKIVFDPPPQKLPASSDKRLNKRKVSGDY